VKATLKPENKFSKAPPGFSLTGPPGKWAWENPPEYSTPSEAVDVLIENLEKPKIQEMYVQLLASGVSIQELVVTMTKLGFMEGKFSVDVAEIIKGPLAIYLMGLAVDAGVPAKVFVTKDGNPPDESLLNDAQILSIMKDRNPEFNKFIVTELPGRIAEDREKKVDIQENSFLGVESPLDEGGE
tara:strand:- start:654 stop:1205 length:552 start_codon:yes stop_codon:yes gene_type:complete